MAGFCEHCYEPLGSLETANYLTCWVPINFLRKTCTMEVVIKLV